MKHLLILCPDSRDNAWVRCSTLWYLFMEENICLVFIINPLTVLGGFFWFVRLSFFFFPPSFPLFLPSVFPTFLLSSFLSFSFWYQNLGQRNMNKINKIARLEWDVVSRVGGWGKPAKTDIQVKKKLYVNEWSKRK